MLNRELTWPVKAGCAGFGLSLVLVYTFSTLSHWFTEESQQARFRRLDQACIYLLIVASYTPFSVGFLHGVWWWIVLGVMWAVAIAGFVSKLLFAHRLQRVSIWLYLILGWVPAVTGAPFSTDLPSSCFDWILAGGIAYTVGTVFLFCDKRVWYFHGIWHLFVILGSLLHFLAVMRFVVVG